MIKKLTYLLLMLVMGVTSTWAQFDDGEYLIKNVATGQYLQGDSYWGTKAVTKGVQYLMTLTKVSDGVYTIKSQQPNGENLQFVGSGADPFIDALSCDMTFTASGDYYTIHNGTGNLYVEATSGIDNTTVNLVKAGDVTTDYAKWQIISKASIVYDIANATVNNTKTTPKDATIYIKDAGFDVHNENFSNWTLTSDGGDYYLVDGGNAGHNYQCWNSNSFDMSQTLSGIANGKYKVSCYGYYRYNTETGENNNAQAITAHSDKTEVLNAKLYAGGNTADIKSVANYEGSSETLPYSAADCLSQWQAAANFNAGYFLNEVSDVKVTNGTLKFGVKKDARSGIDWTVFDDFKLYYTPDYSDLATLVASVEAGSNETAKAYVSAIDFTNKKDDLTQGQIDAYYNALTAIVNGTKDFTSAIVNPSFENGVSDLGTPAGWTVAGNPATSDTNTNKYGAASTAVVTKGTYSYYTGWNGRNVSQKVYLPKGFYELTADAASWGASLAIFGNGQLSTPTVCSDNTSNTLSVKFEVTDATTPVTIGIAGTNGATSPYAEGGTWGYFVDNFTLTDISFENGQDITDNYVTNPSFEDGDLSGWTNSNNIMSAVNNTSFDNKQGTYYAQAPNNNRTFGLTQTLSNLPTGYYVVSAYAYKSGNYGTEPYIQANTNDKVNILTNSDKYYVATQVSSFGGFTIGVGGKGASSVWMPVDDFHVTYYSTLPDVTATEGKMGATESAALTAAKDAYDADKTAANYNAFQNANMAAKLSAKNYAPVKVAYDNAVAVLTSAEKTTFDENETVKAYVNGTITDFTNAVAAINEAKVKAIVSECGKNVTTVITNPSFESSVSALGVPEGWTVTGDPATADADADKYGAQNDAFNGQTGTYCYYTGYNGRNVSQVINYLPKGIYKLTADATSWSDPGASVVLFANNTFGTITPVNTSTNISVTFEVTADNTPVTIGIADTDNATSPYTNGGTWGYRVDNFQLTYVGFSESRTTAANSYGTICLPYDATAEGAVVMEFTGRTSQGLEFTPVADEVSMKAGVPYLYRATADAQTFTTTGTTYVAPVNEGGFVGVYTAQDVPSGKYFLYTSDNMFHPAGSYVHMNAYKCYFDTLPEVGNARVNSNSVVFGIYGDETTGLQTINTAVDLNKNGKFIQNGRLVIVKNGKQYNTAGQAVK